MSSRFVWVVVATAACRFEAPLEAPRAPTPDIDSGRHVPPAAGQAFVLMVMTSTTVGFDLDGRCSRGDLDCSDRALDLRTFEDFVRGSMLRASPAMLIEIAGVDAPGMSDRVSINFYLGLDANDRLEDNFLPLEYEGPCCEYKIDPRSLEGAPPVPRWSVPAIGHGDRFVSTAPGTAFVQHVGYVGWAERYGADYAESSLEAAHIELAVAPDGSSISGRLGGALTIATLHRAIDVDFSRPELSALELVLIDRQPDVDLDGDGLEELIVGPDGNLSECRDGGGTVVPPLDPAEPGRCADRREMADGFSAAHRFAGVRAHAVIGPVQ